MPGMGDITDGLFVVAVLLVFVVIFIRVLGAPRGKRRPPYPSGRRTDTSRELGGGWHMAGMAGGDAGRHQRGSDGGDGDTGGSDGGGGDGGGGGGD